MNYIALAIGLSDVEQRRLIACFERQVASNPQMDPATTRQFPLGDGALLLCAHEAPSRLGRRVPVHADDEAILAFDGAPMLLEDGFSISAEAILRAWPDKATALEGEYAIVHFDKRRRTVTVMTDPLALRPLYWYRHGDKAVIGNALLFPIAARGYHEIDERALATRLGLSYPMLPDTLAAGIERVPPGTRQIFDLKSGDSRTETYFSTSIALQQRNRIRDEGRVHDYSAVWADFERSFAVAADSYESVYLPLSGGLDSRVLLATGLPYKDRFTVYTHGPDSVPDVRIAVELATKLGLRHRRTEYASPIEADGFDRRVKEFVGLSDGQANFAQMFVALAQMIDPVNGTAVHTGSDVAAALPANGGAIGKGASSKAIYRLIHPFSNMEVRGYIPRMASRSSALSGEGATAARQRLMQFFADMEAAGAERGDLLVFFYLWVRTSGWLGANRAAQRNGVDYITPQHCRSFIAQALALGYVSRGLCLMHRRIMEQACPDLMTTPFTSRFPKPNRTLDMGQSAVNFVLGMARDTAKRVLNRPYFRPPSGPGEKLLVAHLRTILPWLKSRVLDSRVPVFWTLVDRAAIERCLISLSGPDAGVNMDDLTVSLNLLRVVLFDEVARETLAAVAEPA